MSGLKRFEPIPIHAVGHRQNMVDIRSAQDRTLLFLVECDVPAVFRRVEGPCQNRPHDRGAEIGLDVRPGADVGFNCTGLIAKELA